VQGGGGELYVSFLVFSSLLLFSPLVKIVNFHLE